MSTDDTQAAARCIGPVVLLLVWAFVPQAANAQAAPSGVFSDIQTAIAPRTSPALEPATVRSRVVQVDTQKITAARRGRETLKLNLFDDAVVEVQIQRVRPTRTGYFISGTPRGMDWGEVRLVVNGPIMVGTVVTPEAKFTIRSAGQGRHVIRQIDPAREPFDCEVEDAPFPSAPGLPAPPENAISSIEPPPSPPLPPAIQRHHLPTEDGSEIRILMLYTPAMQARQGGPSGMLALVDLLVQSANQAFEDGGINPRLVLAHTAMVDYVSQDPTADLIRLKSPGDGYMDEVHALRNEYAADLVHLLPRDGGGGSASRLSFEAVADDLGFAVSASRSEHVFVHELGHTLGLAHDRYAYRSSSVTTTYPYAFGYVNKRAFESGAPETARWRTVMSYEDRCADAGFRCEWLLRFSNPDQTYEGDPLGVAAGGTNQGVDGPADARLAINNIARWVGSFRSEACTHFTVSPRALIAAIEGGELIVEVDTTRGCLWEASSQSEFLTVTSDTLNAGSGFVHVEVQANAGEEERSGTLTVAGVTINVRQIATTDGFCGRTNAVLNAIVRAANIPADKKCDEISDDDLAGVTTLDLHSQNINSLKSGDFSGLSSLQRLDLRQNQLSELPKGIFDGLSELEYLDLSQNQLAGLPRGAFAGLAALQELRLEINRLDRLPEDIYAGLSSLKRLRVFRNQLTELPAGIFSGLASLEDLDLGSNRLTQFPKGVFAGLARLEELDLRDNELTDIPERAFGGLTSLKILSLDGNRLTALPQELFAGLSALRHLGLERIQLTELPNGLLSGLSNLESVNFYRNQLTELSESTFSGLGSLRVMSLRSNQLTVLPESTFDDLSSLERLDLGGNRLTDLPQGVFAGISGLQHLLLHGNQLASLPEGLFAGLRSLSRLELQGNRIADLPAGIFSELSTLEDLDLSYNHLSRLPPGVFSGLVALGVVNLGYNLVDPLPLSLSLEKVGEDRFKAIAPSGAPFALSLPVSTGGAGMIEGDALSLTIPAGAMESASLQVTRDPGALEPVEVDLGTLPGLPGQNSGYVLKKDESLPLRVLPSLQPTDAALTSLIVSTGTLEPIFTTDTVKYAAFVAHDVSTVTVTPTTSHAGATAGFLNESDNLLADADPAMDGHQLNLVVGANTIKVRVRSEDESATEIYTLLLTRDGPTKVCVRTARVREAILSAVSGISVCSNVTAADLSSIARLHVHGLEVVSLKSEDLAGLTALEHLSIANGDLSLLPAAIFGGLSRLDYLFLGDNELRSLPEDVFSDLSSLRVLVLSSNKLRTLPSGLFSGLNALERLELGFNDLSRLPSDIFSGLRALKELNLHRNLLFDPPSGIFSGLTSLQALHLSRNSFSNLPDGLFSGLASLETLTLQQNPVDPLPLPISLVKVGESQFKAVAPTGAPFTLKLPVNIVSAGAIEDGASAVTIPAGAAESSLVGVTRVAGTEDAVTVDIGTPPDLPEKHRGYVLEKDDSLPREILPGPKAPPPGRVTGVGLTVGIEQLEVAWMVVADADGYRLQWKSGEEEYDEARQAMLTGGDLVSYTITGLVAGTEYTIRVLATKQDTDDGTPSTDVVGTPKAAPPAQVERIEAAAGVERLEVSWTAMTGADGYKVQWKSGEQEYEESRQSVLSDGDTESYTIEDLAGGVEYTVRVIATRAHADDGEPSEEVTGIPRAMSPDQVMGVALDVGVEQLEVSWAVVSGADGYKVQWKSGDEAYDESRHAALSGGDVTSHLVTGLTAGTEYTVRVIAVMANADDGAPSIEVTGLPRASAPAEVTGLEVTVVVGELEVSWTAVTDADGYKVEWKSGDEAYDELRQAVLSGGGTTSHSITDLTPGAVYTVRVIATKAHADDGAPSEEVTGTPKASPPAQVTGVAIAVGVELLEVSWTAVSDADGYKVQWKLQSEGFNESRQAGITGGGTISRSITDLTPGATYTVRVIAAKAHADDGAPSDEVTGIPKAEPPAQVTGVAVEPAFEELDVSWDAVSDANGYKVQWKSGTEDYDEARQVALLGGETTRYKIIDLTADTEYTIRVIATKEHADDGEPSDEATATPISADPDVNGDGMLDGNDALILYHTFASSNQLGDGETGGTAESRQSLLAGYSGKADPTDDELKAMIRKANAWKAGGVDSGGDINEDGEIDGKDAFVMYYAYTNANLVGDGETGGTERFRRLLLASYASRENPSDEDLKAMLKRANELREEFG